ncbi:MAG: 3TM-type holin [Nitrosomonadaceae bacterium]
MNPIMSLIGQVFEPAAKLIDELHTSDEERIDAKTRMLAAQTGLTMKVLDYEAQLMQMQSSIVLAEANGKSWLQRNWRPITMMVFLFLVVMDSFGFLPFRLADQAWTLLQIGLGGYVVGRSGEKVMSAMKSK